MTHNSGARGHSSRCDFHRLGGIATSHCRPNIGKFSSPIASSPAWRRRRRRRYKSPCRSPRPVGRTLAPCRGQSRLCRHVDHRAHLQTSTPERPRYQRPNCHPGRVTHLPRRQRPSRPAEALGASSIALTQRLRRETARRLCHEHPTWPNHIWRFRSRARADRNFLRRPAAPSRLCVKPSVRRYQSAASRTFRSTTISVSL